jgi:hypothetical protein
LSKYSRYDASYLKRNLIYGNHAFIETGFICISSGFISTRNWNSTRGSSGPDASTAPDINDLGALTYILTEERSA